MTRKVRAFQIYLHDHEIRQPLAKRRWMDVNANAYRCLPLVMANQLGWEVYLERDVTVLWLGHRHPKALIVKGGEAAASHFGFGVLTFHMYHLFRTPEDVNLLVTGPPNNPKKGIAPLEGYVETDWSHMSFTMNWQVMSPFRLIRFRKGEPICRILPYPRGYFESFEFEHIPHREMPEDLRKDHTDWALRRLDWLKDLSAKGEAGMKAEHGSAMMKDYAKNAVQNRVKGCPFHR